MQNGRFEGKVGLVAGAAGGIGSETARIFAADGAHVLLIDVNDAVGTDLRDRLIADGCSAEYHHCDVRHAGEMADLFERLSGGRSRIDFAANLVGGSGEGDLRGVELHDHTEVEWETTQALSLRSTFLCMKHEISSMLQTGGGSIVNVSSMAGLRVTFDATPAYSAAKAGVIHLSRYAAVAYADRGIRVNVVAPGLTVTPHAVAVLGSEVIERALAATHCIPRAAEALDQANAIAWLCSDEAAMVTGHTLPVSGGWNAR